MKTIVNHVREGLWLLAVGCVVFLMAVWVMGRTDRSIAVDHQALAYSAWYYGQQFFDDPESRLLDKNYYRDSRYPDVQSDFLFIVADSSISRLVAMQVLVYIDGTLTVEPQWSVEQSGQQELVYQRLQQLWVGAGYQRY